MPVINELRIYTLKAGMGAEAAKNSGTVGRDIRGDNYGKLEGYWITEIGPLNQVVHLWTYESLNDRSRLRGELAKNKRWTEEYIPLIRPYLLRQDIRLMNPVIAPAKPATTGNVYELRYYRTRPGGVKPWLDAFTGALEVRQKYSKISALWTTEAGQPNEVVHLWAYPDLNARAKARGEAIKDPGWQAFLKTGGPLLDEMNSLIMVPSAHSPMH
jgi:hypothetical protein